MTHEVIWADDKEFMRRMMIDMFQFRCKEAGLDITVDEASEGQELIEKIRANGYVLAFTDYSMPPGLSGIDAIKQMRTEELVIPLYLLSLHDTLGESANQAGATGYVVKDRIDDMHKLMDKAIELHLKQHKTHYDVLPLL